MLQPSYVASEEVKQLERIKQRRYNKQAAFELEYMAMLNDTVEKIRRDKCALIEENMRLEIRNWISTYFQQTGKIPELPAAESGGSRIIFSRQVLTIYFIAFSKCYIYIQSYIFLNRELKVQLANQRQVGRPRSQRDRENRLNRRNQRKRKAPRRSRRRNRTWDYSSLCRRISSMNCKLFITSIAQYGRAKTNR